jgi:CRP-like cAMP-binding protein
MKEGAGMALSRAAKSLDPKVTFLRSLPAFSGLRDRDIVSLSSLFDEVRMEAGERLVREGEPGHELFLLADGLALVSLREEALATIGAGELVGEMSLLEPAPSSATVTALTPVRALVAGARSFGALLGHPEVMRLLALTLARRLRASQGSPARWQQGRSGMSPAPR